MTDDKDKGKSRPAGNPRQDRLKLALVMADVFRISAFRAEFERAAVIVPWAEI